MGELLAVVALTLFSTNVVLTRVASGKLGIYFGFLISMLVNVLFSLLLLAGRLLVSPIPLEWNGYGFALFLGAGFFSTYLGRWLLYDSIARLGPSKASTFQASNPLFTVILAWTFLNESLGPLDVTAIGSIIFGLLLVSYVRGFFSKRDLTNQDIDSVPRQPTANKLDMFITSRPKALLQSGIALGVFSAASYAMGNVLRGAAIQTWNEPIVGALIGATLGCILHLITGPKVTHLWAQLKTADRTGVYLYAATGILTIIAQICVIASMHYIPVSIASLITMSTPVLVTPLSYFLLDNQEGISLQTIIGILFVLSGISLILLL